MDCPCCGQQMSGPFPIDELKDLRLSGQHRLLIDTLARAYPRSIRRDLIIETLYPNPDDEPDSATTLVSVIVSKINRIIPDYGWNIENTTTRGRGTPARYCLKMVDMVA